MRISDWSSDVCSSDLLFQSVGTRAVGTLIAGTDSDAMSVICLAVFLHDAQGDDVEKEGDDEQHQAKRKSGKCLGAVEFLIAGQQLHRSEECRVGKECVSTCRSRWVAYH